MNGSLRVLLGCVALGATVLSGCYVETRPIPARAPVVVAEPAPAPAVVAVPEPGVVWVAAGYRWDGRAYAWHPGHYERARYPHTHAVPRRW